MSAPAIDVRLESGSVHVIAERRDQPVAHVEPAESNEASRSAAAETKVELRDNILYVQAPRGRWLGRAGQVRIEVRTPLDSDARLRAASADVTCHGRLAGVNAKTASGDIYVEHASGDVVAQTASGNVRAARVDGHLRVNTASGDVTARKVGGTLVARTASGLVEAGEAGTDVRVDTASGDVRIGEAAQGGVRVNTASGDVSVGVRAGTGVWLDLSTTSGTTRSDLDVGATVPATGHDLGLNVRTLSGDISVHRVTAAHA